MIGNERDWVMLEVNGSQKKDEGFGMCLIEESDGLIQGRQIDICVLDERGVEVRR